jgi:hypothetical protein
VKKIPTTADACPPFPEYKMPERRENASFSHFPGAIRKINNRERQTVPDQTQCRGKLLFM